MPEHPGFVHASPDQDNQGFDHRTFEIGSAVPLVPSEVTILLAEDEPTVRHMLGRALRRQGYQIIDVADGIEAISLLDLRPAMAVHLLITDLDMPRLGGIDLAAQLRAAERVQRVIFMTGDIFRPMPRSDLTSALLRKPFSLKQLADTVQELLSR